MTGSGPGLDEADQSVSRGDLAGAERLLMKACEGAPNDPPLLLKLAAVQRASGRAEQALATVERALSVEPLDFTALLLRASLLDRLGRPGTDEAWSHALAQKPGGPLPAEMGPIVATAEARVRKWTDDREARMVAAMAASEAHAGDDERKRITRFRTNVLRRTRPFHSEPTHFHFPELAEREFHPRRLFPWLSALEAATDAIAEELQGLLASRRAALVPYIQYGEHLPLDQWRALNQSADWSALHLFQHGASIEANAELCPKTLEIVAQCDQPQIRGASPNAMFSFLAPKTQIPPHVGVQNSRLVCHLPLVVPNGCWFRVGAEKRVWERGKAFVFDDTIEHEASNPTDELRVILIFDTWHPDLSAAERQAVQALIEVDGVPGAHL